MILYMRARTCLAQVLTRYIERCPSTNALVQAMFVCRVQAMLVGVCLAQALRRYIVPCPSTTVALSKRRDCIFVLPYTCIVLFCLSCASIDGDTPTKSMDRSIQVHLRYIHEAHVASGPKPFV